MSDWIRRTVEFRGVVQGVGFRPAICRLARGAGLSGSVQNRRGSVRLVLAGGTAAVDAFLDGLPRHLPPGSRVESVTDVASESLAVPPAEGFHILESENGTGHEVLIPADLSLCPDCAAEVLDPASRRYGYAFTTCTRCGPRYTVLRSMPYDRARTTMSVFPLCDACRAEYDDPADRRFHAESMACPACGPRLVLETTGGQMLPGNPLRAARHELEQGRILAVLGLGGFGLAADAFHRGALERLRERKHRPHKPFAVMARDLETARLYARIPDAAAALLLSPESPIVVVEPHPEVLAEGRLPMDLLNPDTRTLGIMIPTTPLHLLLFHPLQGDPVPRFDLLVMTSGNRGGEPICLTGAEARDRLGGIADLLLLHDRAINLRNDDSLCALRHDGVPQVWRRARGYAPLPVRLGGPVARCALAAGADMKNTVAFAYGDRVVLSPHVGDLDTPEAVEGFEQVVAALPEFLERVPDVVAVDLHPDMQSTRMGRRLAARAGIDVVAVQHHHAHAVACLAEHGMREGLVLVMDGTGLGTDGTVWGAEVLRVDRNGFRRLATFEPAPLPGGDMAVRCPARQVVGRWAAAEVPVSAEWIRALGITREEAGVWEQQCRQGLNAPLSHAAGRVFDSFSVLLGLAPGTVTYEGQSAIRLEAAARQCPARADIPVIPWTGAERGGLFRIDWSPAFRLMAGGVPAGFDTAAWAMAVHHAVARAAFGMISYASGLKPVTCVGLSGGVFLNRVLCGLLGPMLEGAGMRPLFHAQTPPGDGCIALGQAVIAAGERKQESSCV